MNPNPFEEKQRNAAETQLADAPPAHVATRGADALLHELRVRQAELEMQNEELRASEEKYRLIVESMADGVWVVDNHGTTVFANRRMAEMLGYRVYEMDGRRFSDFIDEEQRALAEARLEQHRHDAGERLELKFRRRDGGELWASLSANPLTGKDGEHIGALLVIADISARKQAESLLHRWQQFVKHAAWGMTVGDFESRTIRQVNPAFAQMHGYGIDELVGTPSWVLYAPESRADLPRLHDALIQAGRLTFECVRLRKDGSTFPAEVDIVLLYDDQNQPNGYIANVQDISARKQAEKMWHESEARFRATFEQAAVGIAHVSLDGVFLRLNQKFCEIAGYPLDELLKLTFQDITHPDDLGPDLDNARRLMAGEQQTYAMEKRYFRKDHSLVWINLTASLVRGQSGEPKYFIAVIEDISSRRQAEELLHDSEERFRTLYGSIRDAIFVHHIEAGGVPGHFVEVNDVACSRLGYSRDELLSLSPLDIDAPDSSVDIGPVAERLASGKNAIFEQIHVTRDGRRIPVEISVNPFVLDGRNAVIALVRDITERKLSEWEIIESNERLRELSAHLQTVREEEKARVAREIHDELGGTLTALKIDVYWLAHALPMEMTPFLERTESMSNLLDGAVQATRRIITELRPSILDDLGLLATLEWQCAQFQKRTGIECRAQCSEDLGGLDKERSIALFRIFQEALTNVTRHAEASAVAVEFRHDERNVRLTVRDNGRGLPEGQVVPATSYGLRGMGERVANLGGQFRIASPAGGGLELEVILPLGDAGRGGNNVDLSE